MTREVTIQPRTATVNEHPSPVPSVVSCSAAVRPTDSSVIGTSHGMNTVDATELIYEGKAEQDKPKEGDEEIEDLRSQIVSKDDLEELTSISSLSESNKKRKTDEERGSKTEKESVKCNIRKQLRNTRHAGLQERKEE